MRLLPCLVLLAACATDPSEGSESSDATVDDPLDPSDPADPEPDDTGTPDGTGDTALPTTPTDPPAVCDDVVCRYVRAGAEPGGDGSDWARAWTVLPDPLARGEVLLVAAGSYPGYTFDDPAVDTASITVLRATVAEHGTDTGWDDTFDGAAEFGPIVVDAPFVVFDGQGRELVVRGDFEGTAVDVRADDVTLRSLDIDGAFVEDGGQHTEGACTALEVSGTNVVVADSEIHDAADDGAVVYGASGFVFEDNEVHALHGCGTDGGCGGCYNGHSDGLELFDVTDSVLRRNLVYDVRSTSTLFFGNWGAPDEYVEDLVIENNLFYAPEVGLVVYLQYANRIRFVHNVVWGVRQGGYGGLSVGPEVTDLDLYDNILLSVNLDHTGGVFDPLAHRGDHNLLGVDLGQWPASPADLVVGDPGFVGIADMDGAPVLAPVAEDFALQEDSPARDAGVVGVDFPTTDFFGAPRDALPDIGAIEVQP